MRIFISGLAILGLAFGAHAEEAEVQPEWELQAFVAAELCLNGEGPAADRGPTCQGIIYNACPGSGGSNFQMDECLKSENKFWDAKLNSSYKALMQIYASEDQYEEEGSYYLLAPKLREAQRAWLAYRDAKCVKFERNRFRGGTMGRLTAGWCFTEMTADRALELELLLEEERM